MCIHALRRRYFTAVSVVLAVLGVVPVVHAGDAADQPLRKHVSYANLDLNDPADVSILYERLHQAALDVCQPNGFGPTLRVEQMRMRCVAKAMDGAVSKINAAALTARYIARR